MAVALSMFGQESAFVTKLPYGDVGEATVRELRSFGVDVSHIARGGERIGVMFAAASGCLNQTLEGDFCLFGTNDVWNLADGDYAGRIKR